MNKIRTLSVFFFSSYCCWVGMKIFPHFHCHYRCLVMFSNFFFLIIRLLVLLLQQNLLKITKTNLTHTTIHSKVKDKFIWEESTNGTDLNNSNSSTEVLKCVCMRKKRKRGKTNFSLTSTNIFYFYYLAIHLLSVFFLYYVYVLYILLCAFFFFTFPLSCSLSHSLPNSAKENSKYSKTWDDFLCFQM